MEGRGIRLRRLWRSSGRQSCAALGFGATLGARYTFSRKMRHNLQRHEAHCISFAPTFPSSFLWRFSSKPKFGN
jgi:hypothetical protein